MALLYGTSAHDSGVFIAAASALLTAAMTVSESRSFLGNFKESARILVRDEQQCSGCA